MFFEFSRENDAEFFPNFVGHLFRGRFVLNRFRSYQLSVKFCRNLQICDLPAHLRDQLKRASASICLNLAEGFGRLSPGDRVRFYKIAFGSIREIQAIFDIGNFSEIQSKELDYLAASVYKLIQNSR